MKKLNNNLRSNQTNLAGGKIWWTLGLGYLTNHCPGKETILALAGVAQWIECCLRTQSLLVGFPVRAHAWVVGWVPGWGCVRGNQSMYLLYIDVSLPLFLPPFPPL